MSSDKIFLLILAFLVVAGIVVSLDWNSKGGIWSNIGGRAVYEGGANVTESLSIGQNMSVGSGAYTGRYMGYNGSCLGFSNSTQFLCFNELVNDWVEGNSLTSYHEIFIQENLNVNGSLYNNGYNFSRKNYNETLLDGSGTSGTIAKWSDSNTFSDSVIDEDSTEITFGLPVEIDSDSSYGGGWSQDVETLQTTDATPTTIFSIPVAIHEEYIIEVVAVGYKSDYSTRFSSKFSNLYYRGDGDVITQGGDKSIYLIESSPGLYIANSQPDTGNQEIDINVIGGVGDTVNWKAYISYMKVVI
jgi:hypothetical protein